MWKINHNVQSLWVCTVVNDEKTLFFNLKVIHGKDRVFLTHVINCPDEGDIIVCLKNISVLSEDIV